MVLYVTEIFNGFDSNDKSGDHFVMYRDSESVCCTPGTNSVVGHLKYNQLKKNS